MPKAEDPSRTSKRELTNKELNKLITAMRVVVKKAILFTTRKIEHQRAVYRRGAAVCARKRRRAERCAEELQYIRKMLKTPGADEITKFALLNTKSFNELYVANNTPLDEFCLYKVATAPVMIKAVDAIRQEYPNWYQEIPFLLQRFGLQARLKRTDEAGGVGKRTFGGKRKDGKEFGRKKRVVKKRVDDVENCQAQAGEESADEVDESSKGENKPAEKRRRIDSSTSEQSNPMSASAARKSNAVGVEGIQPNAALNRQRKEFAGKEGEAKMA